MNRKKLTWFGIKLNQRQATSVFVLSLAGILFLTLILSSFLYPFIMMIISAIRYDEIEYISSTLMYILPYIIVIITSLTLCIYSLIRSRRIAKSYSELIVVQNSESRAPLFCPNCGNKRIGRENFCKMCGEELK